MKTIYSLLYILVLSLVFSSCDSDDKAFGSVGYLQLSIEGAVSTKGSVPENYDPKTVTVVVTDSKGTVKYNDVPSKWPTKGLELDEGVYTVSASSANFDGQAAAFDIPYYSGSTTVTISGKTQTTAYITCTLANVKVSVDYDDALKGVFESINVSVYSDDASIDAVDFGESETRSAYFPAGKLLWKLTAVTKSGNRHSINQVLAANAKAKEHYNIHVKPEGTGSSNIVIEVEKDGNQYTLPILVPLKNDDVLFDEMSANPWATVAYLSGKAENQSLSDFSDENVKFKYRVDGTDEWTKVDAVKTGNTYTATITGLDSNTKYHYRLVYESTDLDIESNSQSFTTESIVTLPNGNMDDWYLNGKVAYAVSSTDYSANLFWDSGNKGTATVGSSITQGVSEPVHTSGGKAAELKSDYIVIKFAAASLYAGSFGSLVGSKGAKINFGRPFVGRPTQLTGWFQYTSGKIDYVGDSQPSNTVSKGDQDMWSAYVVLTTGTYQLNNTDMSGTSKDFPALLANDDDDFVVAYGALSDDFCRESHSDWTQFTVDLTYKNLTAKPTHIIIVFSSSKYGDYFTGSTSSVLYLDDLELVYGEPKVKE